MDNCVITFKIGGESIELSVDSSSLPNDYVQLKKLFREQDKWNSFISQLKSFLKNRKTISDINLDELIDSDHIISNGTVADLKARFPSEQFPEDTDEYNISSKKILLVKKYKTKKGKLLYGRIINKNGEEIFIVDFSHIKSLINYFTFQKQISSSDILLKINDIYKKQLEIIYQKALLDNNLKQPLEDYVKNRVSKIEKIEGETKKEYEDRKKQIEDRLKMESLLILFTQNKTPFKKMTYEYNSENFGAYRVLNNLAEQILQISNKKKTYSDRVLEDLVRSVDKYSKDFSEAQLSKNFVIELLPNDLKQKFIELDLKNKDDNISYKKVNEELNKSIKDNRTRFNSIFGKAVVDKYDENTDGWNILIQEILNRDKTFNFNYKKQENNKIILEKFHSNLENTFGIGFEQLLQYNEPKYYNGKYILEEVLKDGSKRYYVTNYYTTEFLLANKFNTREEAEDFIDNNDETEIIKNSYKALHSLNQDEKGNLISDDKNNLYFFYENYIPVKTLITVLDYDVPKLKLENVKEDMRGFISSNLEELKVSDFREFVKNKLDTYLKDNDMLYSDEVERILNLINTPERIFLFVSQLNNPKYKTVEGKLVPFDLSSKKDILDLAEEIGNINKYRYYYVKNRSSSGLLTLIRTNPEIIPDYRKDRRYPIKNVLTAAQKVLSPKLGGAKLNILTDSQIQEMLGEEYSKFSAKAFIKGNEIYINSDKANPEDLFHEYVHIIMAYLKTNEETKDQYIKLLEEVWNFKENDSKRLDVERIYSDYALIDKMEEYFAIKFGDWIKNNSQLEFGNIFSNSILKKGTKILFDPNNSSKSIKQLYGKTLYDVFLNFNSEIAQYLENNKSLGSEGFEQLFTLTRKRSEWIRKQIHDGKLEEYDCI